MLEFFKFLTWRIWKKALSKAFVINLKSVPTMLVHLKYCIVHYTLGLERWWKIITHPHRSHFEGGLICSIIGSKCVHKDSHINKSNYIITAFPIQLVFNSYSQAGGPFSTCVFSPPTLRAGRLLLLHGKTGGNFASLFSIPSINCSSCHTILWRLLILHLNNWACK